MQATMKNTKMPSSKGYNSEALGREILKQINDIGHLKYKLKKDVNDIYSIVLSKPGSTFFFEGYKAELWEAAFDDFSKRWKEIDLKKYNVDCMVRHFYDVVMQEDEKRKGKIVLNIKGGVTSMVK